MLEAFANLVVRGFCKELAQSRGGCNAITVTGLPLGLLQLEPLQRVCWYVCVHLRWLCNCYLVGFFLLSDRETYCKRIRWCRHTALCTVDKVKAIDSITFIGMLDKNEMFSFWNVLKNGVPFLECDHNEMCSFWNVIKMKCAQNGMCPFWNVLKMECDQNGMCSFWNIPFLRCDQNEICSFWNVSFLESA